MNALRFDPEQPDQRIPPRPARHTDWRRVVFFLRPSRRLRTCPAAAAPDDDAFARRPHGWSN